MAKIVKLIPDNKPDKKVPAWKNREAIDIVKDDIVKTHNRKLKDKNSKS
ncbi:hypothetical protein FHS59_002746 [Algoriphagus iocasae]|uniref:Uncharacterized protein n=1 Tax=Algoriphagus iocasae TaxID=1836499 RepID=A0A841MWY7_9BACT|nr:hypothetical protein [Algoriphagus iocasae]MBB6327118.1 hypothetical protein [Algoriphagus iocasae]